MLQSNRRTLPCEHRERLYKYMSQTTKALVAAQEQQLTDMPPSAHKSNHFSGRGFGSDLIAAAMAWKRARLSYEQHVKEHGCSVCSDRTVAA